MCGKDQYRQAVLTGIFWMVSMMQKCDKLTSGFFDQVCHALCEGEDPIPSGAVFLQDQAWL